MKNQEIIFKNRSTSYKIIIGKKISLIKNLLKKPTISVVVKDSGYGIPSILSSNSCLKVTKDNFENQTKKILEDKEFKNEIIKNSTNYISSYLSNVGTASEKILDFLINYKLKK